MRKSCYRSFVIQTRLALPRHNKYKIKQQSNFQIMREKMHYSRPLMAIERFIPQAYCDICFTYQAILKCDYGAAYNPNLNGGGNACWEGGVVGSGAQHGAPCANSYITVTVVNGVASYVGHEGAGHEDVPLESVYIPNIASLNQGDIISGATWTSADDAYHHKGGGEVTSWTMTKPGHPNHS